MYRAAKVVAEVGRQRFCTSLRSKRWRRFATYFMCSKNDIDEGNVDSQLQTRVVRGLRRRKEGVCGRRSGGGEPLVPLLDGHLNK